MDASFPERVLTTLLKRYGGKNDFEEDDR